MKYFLEVDTDETGKITKVSARVPDQDFVIELPETIINNKGKKAKIAFSFLWRIVRLVDSILKQGE